ncbi:MAG TPA: FtsX-like permease family protein, partial [Rhodothermales bacterium]|nr:FtsX-like permease family protein [Rhodothermales bacterium]
VRPVRREHERGVGAREERHHGHHHGEQAHRAERAGEREVAVLAGAYPALVLSSYRPDEALRGRARVGLRGLVLRRGLVVTQFVLAVVLVSGAFVVQRQLGYMRAQRLGFDSEQVVVLPLGPYEGVRARGAAFKDALLASGSVEAVTLTDQYPSRDDGNNQVFLPAGQPDEAGVMLWTYDADADFVRTLGLDVAQGRDFDARRGTDSAAFLLNEAAFRQMGFTDVETAEVVDLSPAGRVTHPVAGVVRDFHVASLHHAIVPVIIRLGDEAGADYALVRVRPGQIDAALAHLRRTWAQFSNGSPFDPSFLDQEFAALYQSDRRLGRAFAAFTVLATLIACLGLLGLSAYSTGQRRKEIGVRKVLGAGVPGLVGLLARDFARPVLLALVLAAPVAYLAAERWLSSFAYRTPLGPGPFVLASVLALTVALATVGLYTVRAARADPVSSLRGE